MVFYLEHIFGYNLNALAIFIANASRQHQRWLASPTSDGNTGQKMSKNKQAGVRVHVGNELFRATSSLTVQTRKIHICCSIVLCRGACEFIQTH